MQYGMVIDLSKCMGCQTCATSCRLANNLPSGTWWNTVYTEGGETIDTASGAYPDGLVLQHYPVACQHCKNPACVSVCPTGATYRDEETGIVMTDAEAVHRPARRAWRHAPTTCASITTANLPMRSSSPWAIPTRRRTWPTQLRNARCAPIW